MVESENNEEQKSGIVAPGDQAKDQKVIKAVKKKTTKKKIAHKKVVKKKATKKAAKKKTAKKKVASRKKALKKVAVTPEDSAEKVVQGSNSAEKTEVIIQLTKKTETVGAEQAVEISRNFKDGDDSTSQGETASVELIIKTQSKKEEEPMASTSNGSAGFLPKVFFWLLIVILGFSYIRSLAKHPGSETGAAEQTESSVVSSETESSETNVDEQPTNTEKLTEAGTVETTESDNTQSVDQSPTKTSAHAVVVDSAEGVVVPAAISSVTSYPSAAEESASESVAADTAAATSDSVAPVVSESSAKIEAVESVVASSDETKQLSVAEKMPDAQSVAVESAPSRSTTGAAKSSTALSVTDAPVSSAKVQELGTAEESKPESESATGILKEFDELRNAAEVERKAMYEMMRKQMEMRRSMMQSQPYPRWSNQGYPGYNPYTQGYNPYGYPQ